MAGKGITADHGLFQVSRPRRAAPPGTAPRRVAWIDRANADWRGTTMR
jgi:hypothetical protein